MKIIKSQGLRIPHIGFGIFRQPGDSRQAVVWGIGILLRPRCMKMRPRLGALLKPLAFLLYGFGANY